MQNFKSNIMAKLKLDLMPQSLLFADNASMILKLFDEFSWAVTYFSI